jgi:hypothetical protein
MSQPNEPSTPTRAEVSQPANGEGGSISAVMSQAADGGPISAAMSQAADGGPSTAALSQLVDLSREAIEAEARKRVVAGGADGAEDKVPPSALEGAFEDAVNCGNFEIRGGPLSGRWARACKPDTDLYEQYALQRSRDSKAEFRMEWAKRNLQQLRVSRVHSKSYMEVDKSKGTYMTYPELVLDFGFIADQMAAEKAATNYATKCVKMGGKWLFVEPMSEAVHFLRIRREHSQIFSEKWGLYEKEQEETILSDGKPPTGTIVGNHPEG